jgi:hypothetical protein
MAAHMAEQGDGTGHAEQVVAQAALEEEPPAYGSWATPVLQHRPQQQQEPQGAAAFPAIPQPAQVSNIFMCTLFA